MANKKFKIIFFGACVLVLLFISPVSPKDQYVEPILFGMKSSIPYDMANLFNRFPFQGGLSIILGLGLAGILFFGVITSPFGYMFGVPSEKYVMGDFKVPHPEIPASSSRRAGDIHLPLESYGSPRSVLLDYIQSEKSTPRTIYSDRRDDQEDTPCCQTFLHYFETVVGYVEFWEPGFLEQWEPSLNVLRKRLGGKVGKNIIKTLENTLSYEYTPDFITSMFYWVSEREGDVRNEICQQRMICHAHGTLQYFPETLLKVYHKFSKKLSKVPKEYVKAIKIGMIDETMCAEVYADCLDNEFTLNLKSYMSLLPDRTQLAKMQRRKGKMYMDGVDATW